MRDKLGPIYEERCTKDAWPAEVITCFAQADGFQKLKACRELLQFDAREKLIQQIRTVMAGQGMGMGSGRPPMGHGAGSDAGSAGGSGGGSGGGSSSGSGSSAPAGGSGSDAKPGSAAGSGSAKAPAK